jgi:hypothetical protein
LRPKENSLSNRQADTLPGPGPSDPTGPPREATWYYRKGLGKAGPVTTSEVVGLLLDKRLGASTLLTRTDRLGWRPAAYWPEFEAIVASLVRSGRLPNGVLAEPYTEYLRKRALAMMGLFLSVVMMLAAHATARLLAPTPADHPAILCSSCGLWLLAAGGGIYATFFLRRAWRHMTALPAPIAVMGFIGSVGLIGLTIFTGVVIFVSVVAALF